jgi:hypothetical protein
MFGWLPGLTTGRGHAATPPVHPKFAITPPTARADAATARAGAATAPVNPRFGVTLQGVPQTLAPLTTLTSSLGVTPGTVMWYEQWSWAANFPAAEATDVARLGAQPEITWEPWNPADGVNQSDYSLASIASGAHDAYLNTWAEQIRSWGGTLRLRFAQEMNGDWYPWAEGVNGNTAGSYVAAWRHVYDLFAADGVHNVIWVWSPNVSFAGSTSLTDLWPGGASVDAIALDGYNVGDTTGSEWRSFSDIFSSSVSQVEALSTHPIFIGEVGSGDAGGNKALWIQQMFTTLRSWPQVEGFTWFDFNKEQDWQINSSASSLAAFRSGVASYGL